MGRRKEQARPIEELCTHILLGLLEKRLENLVVVSKSLTERARGGRNSDGEE
jgi:hypothetical protein